MLVLEKTEVLLQQIPALRIITERAGWKNKKIYNYFIDFQKVFDSIDQNVTWDVLESDGVDSQLIGLLKDINENATETVRVDKETGLTCYFRA